MTCMKCKSENVLPATEILPVHWCQDCDAEFTTKDDPGGFTNVVAVAMMKKSDHRTLRKCRLIEARVDGMSDEEADKFLADANIDLTEQTRKINDRLDALRAEMAASEV